MRTDLNPGTDIEKDDVPVPERAKKKSMKKMHKRGKRRGRKSSRY